MAVFLLQWLVACQLWVSDADVCDPSIQRERWYADADRDGYGDPASPGQCAPADGLVPNADDCDDDDFRLGSVGDIGEVAGVTLWCRDADQDGVGRADDCVVSCVPPEGYEAPESGDCDDDNPLFTVVCPWARIDAEIQTNCGLRTDGQIACWGNDDEATVEEAPTDAGYVDVAVGVSGACAIDTSGGVTCWGQAPEPPSELVATRVGVGNGVACALTDRGAITCWGAATELRRAPDGEGYTDLDVDNGSACAIAADGGVACWGWNDFDEVIDAAPTGTGFVQVSVGEYYYDGWACALDGAGAITCWGGFYARQAVPPGDGYVDLDLGSTDAWARRADGTIIHWGDDGRGQLDGYVELDDVVQVVTGQEHGCALRENGEVKCWGNGEFHQTDVPAPAATTLTAGGNSTCVTSRVGEDLVCWGEPLPVPPRVYQSVSAFAERRCATLSSGRIDCWTTTGGTVREVPQGAGYRDVQVGMTLNCASDDAGGLTCWNGQGRPVTPPEGAWSDLDRSYGFVCGLDDVGDAMCFGPNMDPATVPEGIGFTDIAAGNGHACVLDAGGYVDCWGIFYDAYDLQPTPPWDVPEEGGFVQVSCGFVMDCALRPDGTAACWNSRGPVATPAWATDLRRVEVGGYGDVCGLDRDGALVCWTAGGAGSSPVTGSEKPDGDGWVDLMLDDSSFPNACALRDDGEIACWGSNDFPREAVHELTAPSLGRSHGCALWRDEARCFGNDGQGQATAPFDSFVAVAAGGDRSCGIDADGDVTCWGDTATAPVPVGLPPVDALALGDAFGCAHLREGTLACWGEIGDPPSGRWSTVSAGRGHACAVSDAGAVACWGDDVYGQATPPADLPPAAQVVAGGFHTCALGTDGFPTCWGLDSFHQDADPKVRFTALAAGAEHTCGIRLDGLPWCWGRDLEGQATPPAPAGLIGE